MMRGITRTALVGALCLLVAQPSWAARTRVHEAAESQEYGRKFGGMIGRGVLNVSTSFVDLLVNVVNETRSGPALVGTLVGVGKGAGCMTLRALSGVVDLVTFWVPGFNGFPVADSYENCVVVGAPMAAAAAAPAPTAPMMEHPASPPLPPPTPVAPKPEPPRYTK